MSRPAEQREAALVALAASAVDGTPRFSAVSKALGVAKPTLIRWWQAREAAAAAPAIPPAPAPSTTPRSVDVDRRTFQLELLSTTQDALAGAVRAQSWTAVGTLTRRVRDLRNELDQLDAATLAAKGGIDESTVDAMSEEEFLERLRDVAKGTADAYLEVYVAEYMERHGLRFLGATGVG